MAGTGIGIENPNKLGKVTDRKAIAKLMYADAKELFTDNLKELPKEYPELITVKKSNSSEEKYETIGNLKDAEVKEEGKPITYGIITEGHTTTVKNELISNGFSMTYEAYEDNKWDVQKYLRTSELARTMNDKKETAVAKIWDSVTTDIGADGVAYASEKHPLLNNSTEFNNNLVKGEFDIQTYKDAVNRFNHWKNHMGSKFATKADKIICHRDRQMDINAMLESTLVAFEQSNTKNTIPKLKVAFNSYIDELQVHIIDSTIDSAILQVREDINTNYEFDSSGTLNMYFNAFERYKAAMINSGFGFVTITGKNAE